MLLYINTAEFNKIGLGLIDGVNVRTFQKELAFNENYKSLEYLQKFLKHHKVTTPMLTKIVVCSGPGSFTGIRVGVSLAQALGYALSIPVLALPLNKIPTDLRKLPNINFSKKLLLHYGAQPNITKAKEKTRP